MIKSYRDKNTEYFQRGEFVRRFQGFDKIALRKLDMLDAAQSLEDLRMPPSNRLEILKGNRNGQHSIRVNDKWRICFIWTKDGPEQVEIVDYH